MPTGPSQQNNYLFKISCWNTKTKCKNYLSLKMKILEGRQWRRSRFFIVTCEHISRFVLIAGFEQTNVCWAYIEKSRLLTTDQVSMRYFEVFMRKQNLLIIWTYISTTSVSEKFQWINFYRCWFRPERWGLHLKQNLCFSLHRFCFLED